VKEGKETMIGEDRYEEEYLEAVETLTGAGFGHYEVSNFARNGAVSRHNRAYWEHKSYIGLGPGAHSFEAPVRSWNVRDWGEYRQRLSEGKSAREGEEELTEGDVALETVWLGLRSDSGLPLESLNASQRALALSWKEAGLAEMRGERVKMTRKGWLLLDKLAVEMDARRG
jgi:oxygen-independent coproporphyrinogen III oxidase